MTRITLHIALIVLAIVFAVISMISRAPWYHAAAFHR